MKNYMATNEHFLIDVDEVKCVMRGIMEEIGAPLWDAQYKVMMTKMLDHLFYGSIMAGERVLEQTLSSYGAEELLAIKGSRKAYRTLIQCLGLEEVEQMGAGFFEYEFDDATSTVLISRADSKPEERSVWSRSNDPDLYIHDLEHSLDAGDYVPERLRRIVTERRKAG